MKRRGVRNEKKRRIVYDTINCFACFAPVAGCVGWTICNGSSRDAKMAPKRARKPKGMPYKPKNDASAEDIEAYDEALRVTATKRHLEAKMSQMEAVIKVTDEDGIVVRAVVGELKSALTSDFISFAGAAAPIVAPMAAALGLEGTSNKKRKPDGGPCQACVDAGVDEAVSFPLLLSLVFACASAHHPRCVGAADSAGFSDHCEEPLPRSPPRMFHGGLRRCLGREKHRRGPGHLRQQRSAVGV